MSMSEHAKDIIYGINGPVVYVKNARGFKMGEMVYVGEEKLVGEVILRPSSGSGGRGKRGCHFGYPRPRNPA